MSTEPSRQQPSQGRLPGMATIRPSDEKQVSTPPPPPLAGVFEIALDGDGRGGDRTQILQRNESRDVHMQRGALNSEGSKNQDPRRLAQTARDKDREPGLLSFTSWAATLAVQDLRGGSTQRAGRSVLRYAR